MSLIEIMGLCDHFYYAMACLATMNLICGDLKRIITRSHVFIGVCGLINQSFKSFEVHHKGV